jgi:outer membrane receptor protein involved in Fe transport
MTGNAGKARVYGVEYDADLKLGRSLISTAGAYNNAKLQGNATLRMTPSSSISQLPSCSLRGQTTGSLRYVAVAAVDGTRLLRQPTLAASTSIRYDA